MRSGRPSFIAPPVKSNKALEDIRNLLAGTCPAPPTDEVTAANVGSRSNAFAAAEGAPTNPILTLHRACCPCCPSPSPSDGLGSRSLAARRGPSESYAPYAFPCPLTACRRSYHGHAYYGDGYYADIKECSAEILHNAATPVLVEAALQSEKGSYLTSTGALSVYSGAKTGRSNPNPGPNP